MHPYLLAEHLRARHADLVQDAEVSRTVATLRARRRRRLWTRRRPT
jgi:hypothetical protein